MSAKILHLSDLHVGKSKSESKNLKLIVKKVIESFSKVKLTILSMMAKKSNIRKLKIYLNHFSTIRISMYGLFLVIMTTDGTEYMLKGKDLNISKKPFMI